MSLSSSRYMPPYVYNTAYRQISALEAKYCGVRTRLYAHCTLVPAKNNSKVNWFVIKTVQFVEAVRTCESRIHKLVFAIVIAYVRLPKSIPLQETLNMPRKLIFNILNSHPNLSWHMFFVTFGDIDRRKTGRYHI